MKHAISLAKQIEMINTFIKRRNDGNPLPALPDGYRFDADEVKKLFEKPGATDFVVKLGIKVVDGKESISPILCVADVNHQVLYGNGIDAIGDDDEDGSYLDEGRPFPPPVVGP